MSEQDDKNLGQEPEEDFSEMSLDELIRSTKEELQRVDDMMGGGEEYTDESEGGKSAMPEFQPVLPEEYADLMVDGEEGEAEPEPEPKSHLPSGVKVLLYVCCVLAASVLLAIGAWQCANDVLALTKPERAVVVNVAENATIADVSQTLKDNGLIEYPWLFKFYCWFSKAENKIDPGTYELNNLYDYHALVNGMIASSGDRATVTITIPEGYECKDIFALLAENGVSTVEELEKTAANYQFDYAFLQGLAYGDGNRLEGYLFPDTYEFYVDAAPESVLDKFLANFDSKITDDMYAALDALNTMLSTQMTDGGFSAEEIDEAKLDFHDVITIASLVEKETAKTSESATIASVIYNRLSSKLYPCLQIDATIQYALAERKEELSNADKAVISPYNTYTNAGLPAGPIACPGINSIRAALYPAESDYYFYALNSYGYHHFSVTYYEHQSFLDEMESGADVE